MGRKKSKKEKRKINETGWNDYTVMAFNHGNKEENYGLVGARSEPRIASDEPAGGPPETYRFCGDTTYRCDRCLTDLKTKIGVYYMLYAENIDYRKKRIGILDGTILRKFCLNCSPGYFHKDHKDFRCMFCGSKIGKAKQVLEIVKEERRNENEEADVRSNDTVGSICMDCAKKLSKKKNSLLRIFAKIAPPYRKPIDLYAALATGDAVSRPKYQKLTRENKTITHGIYSMAEAVNERNKLLKSMSKTVGSLPKAIAKAARKTRKKR